MDKEGREAAWTTAVQGDLDPSGEVFAKMVNLWKSLEAETVSTSLNPEHGEFGSHIRLLWAAAKVMMMIMMMVMMMGHRQGFPGRRPGDGHRVFLDPDAAQHHRCGAEIGFGGDGFRLALKVQGARCWPPPAAPRSSLWVRRFFGENRF